MALKPLNSPGGFSVGEISTGAINVISSTGNVTTGNLIGSGGGNVNIIAGNLLINGGNGVGNLSVGNLIAAGNVQGAYILGNGSQLTGMYGNADVSNYLSSNANVTILTTGNITTSGSIAATGNVTAENVNIGTLLDVKDINITGQILSDINLGGNVNPGNVNATGNISGSYILGNGYFLTNINAGNIVGSYGNGDVANYLASGSLTSNIITTGNVNGGNLITSGQIIGGAATVTTLDAFSGGTGGSVRVKSGAGLVTVELDGSGFIIANGNVTGANFNTAGNVTGNYLLGNGYFITDIQYGNIVGANANIKAYLESGQTINANFGGGTLYALGNATLGPTVVNGNLQVAGNISATGNITYISVQDLVIDDPLIYLAANNPGDTEDIGIVGSYNDGTYAHTGFVRDHIDDTWKVFTGVTSEPNTVIAWNEAVYAPFKAGPILSNASITANANVVATGNVSGTYILGNGYFLTNINAANIVGSYGNSDVANYLASGSLTSNIVTTGNITGGNLSGTLVTGTLTTAAQPNITSVGTLTSLAVTGNVTSSGNVQGSYLLGNGAFITGLPAGYSNSDVANYLASNAAVTILTTGNITTSGNIAAGNFIGSGANTTIASGVYSWTFDNAGNLTTPAAGNLIGGNLITANYFSGNGSLLTGMYSNLNVANYLPTYTGAINSLTGNVTTTANVQASYLLGNGYFISGIQYSNIAGTYGDANVATYLASGSLTSNIVTTGNITGGNLSGTLVTGTLTTAAQPNITSVGTLTSLNVTGNVTSSGNVSGTYLLGNGAFITGLPAGYSNADVANYLGSNSAVTILTTGNITTSSNVTASAFVGTGSNTTIKSNGYSWVFGGDGNLTTPVAGTITGGNLITANYFSGDGSLLTNINAGNILGAYGNANVKAYLESGATINANIGTGTFTTTGNISGGNIGGALVSGTLTTAAQPNITTLGTLVSLDVSANITAGGIQMSTGNATIGNLYVTGNTTIAGNIQQISGNSGQFFGNAATGFNALYAGLPAGFTLLPQSVMNFVSSFNGYSQVNNQNQNGGEEATVDYVLTGNNGDDETYYFDIGYTSSGFDGALAGANNAIGTAAETNDAYMYTTANVAAGQIGNLILATVDTNSQIRFVVGGRDMGNTALRINSPNTTSANSTSGTAVLQGGLGVTGAVNVSGNITGDNLSGTLITGTLTTAAQPNVTSVGTLTILDVTGNITSSGNVSGNYLLGNGAFITGLPAGYSNADVANYLNSAPNINITLGNSNSNITTGGTIRTYGTSIANNFVANSTVTIQSSATQAVVFDAINQTTSSATLTTLATIDVTTLPADSSALEVTLRGKDGTNTQAGKIMIAWGGTDMDYTRYAEVLAGAGCGVPSVSFDGTNLLIQVTPLNGNSMSWNGSITSV